MKNVNWILVAGVVWFAIAVALEHRKVAELERKLNQSIVFGDGLIENNTGQYVQLSIGDRHYGIPAGSAWINWPDEKTLNDWTTDKVK